MRTISPLFACALLVPAAVAAAQDSAPPASWIATAVSGTEQYAGNAAPPSWLWEDLGARRLIGRNSYSLEGILSRRFDQWDRAVAGEVYATTTHTSYVDVRAQLTPSAKVLPSADLNAEFFQTLPRAWELSAGARRMQYATSGSTIGTIGIGRSVKATYLRLRAIALVGGGAGTGGTNAGSLALTVRQFGRTADDFLELGGAAGHEIVNVGPDQSYDIRASQSAYLRGQRYVTRHLGFAAVGSWSEDRGIPRRLGAYLSAMARW